jgi:hypothetical protein
MPYAASAAMQLCKAGCGGLSAAQQQLRSTEASPCTAGSPYLWQRLGSPWKYTRAAGIVEQDLLQQQHVNS